MIRSKIRFRSFLGKLKYILAVSACVTPGFASADIERLRVFAKLKSVESTIISDQAAADIDAMARSIGFGSTGDVSTKLSLRPEIGYHSNINGGNPSKPIIIGGLTFYGDPSLYQKQGMIYGLRGSIDARVFYDHGRYLDATLDLSHAHSFEHEMGLSTANLDVCSVNHIRDWWYLDLCADGSVLDRSLKRSTTQSQSFTVSKFLETNANEHASLSLGMTRQDTGAFTQNQLTLGIDRLQDDGHTSSLNVTLGEPLPNTLATRHSLSGNLSAQIGARPMQFATSYRHEDGGLFFGSPQENKSLTLTATLPVWRQINATIGYTKTDSTIDHFDFQSPILGIHFASIF